MINREDDLLIDLVILLQGLLERLRALLCVTKLKTQPFHHHQDEGGLLGNGPVPVIDQLLIVLLGFHLRLQKVVLLLVLGGETIVLDLMTKFCW